MPRPLHFSIPESALGLGAAALLCLLSACPQPSAPPASQTTPPAAAPAAPPAAGDSADAGAPADSGAPPADGGDATANGGDATGAPPAPPNAPSDSGPMPGGAGSFQLAQAQLGMSLADVYLRYPDGQGWSYDDRFIPGTRTGTVMAKPDGDKALATEMFTLEDGKVVGFVRAVHESADAFKANMQQFAASYGPASQRPPDWALDYDLFKHWHETPNEQARFWSNAKRQTVLTAALSPSGTETIYMLFDLTRMQVAQAELARAGNTTVPDPDRSPSAPSNPSQPAPGGEGPK